MTQGLVVVYIMKITAPSEFKHMTNLIVLSKDSDKMRKLSILLTPYQPRAYFALFYTNNIHWSRPMETLKSEQSVQRSWKGHRHWLPTMMSQNWWGSRQHYCGAQTTHEKQYNATFLWLERAAAAVSPAVLTSKFLLSRLLAAGGWRETVKENISSSLNTVT